MRATEEQHNARKREMMGKCFDCYAENGLIGTGIKALASGASDRKVVWVQVPSPAPRQVVEIRLVFLLLKHFKTAMAELHQIFDLVEAELVPQTESASFRCR